MTAKIWYSELARNLRILQNAATVEEAALELVQKRLHLVQNRSSRIDLGFVASIVGIDPNFREENLPDDKFAYIVSQNGRDIIVLNKKYPSRRRFSTAHEIAHRLLAGKSLHTKKWRGEHETAIEREEEEKLCDLMATYILGLTPDILLPILADQPVTIDLVEEIKNRFDVSLETAVRACLKYSQAQFAAIYSYIDSEQAFYVERIYSTSSFPRLWWQEDQLPSMTCLKRAWTTSSSISRTQESYTFQGLSYLFYAHARRQTIYRQKRSQQGVFLILELLESPR